MPRSSQVRRQWRVWQRLVASADPLSAEEIADSLSPDPVSARTVRRDLEVLREVGVPVRTVRNGRQVRYWARGDGPEVLLDGDTLLALRLALGLLRPFEGTAVGQALEQLQLRLESRVPPRLLEYFSPLVEGVAVRPDAPPHYGAAEGVFALLRECLAQRRALELAYENVEGKVTHRRVHPQQLALGPRGLYLFALDDSRGGALRTFRVERMRSVRKLTMPARMDPEFRVEDYVSGSLGIYSPEHEPRTIRLRVHTAHTARVLSENPWHASQSITPSEDDTWIVSLVLRSTRELLSHVLSAGPDLEVLEPVELREEVAARLAEAAARYSPGAHRGSRSRSVRHAPQTGVTR